MNLIAITASQNVGQINWEPYIPMIFTRILRSLNLPVCYKNMKSGRNQSLWSSSIASNDFFKIRSSSRTIVILMQNIYLIFLVWIASVLSPKSSAQEYLTKFLGAIESYLHPANCGKWDYIISEIIVQTPKYLFDRLVVERYKPHPWKRPTPSMYGKQPAVDLFSIDRRIIHLKLTLHLPLFV